MHPAGYIEKFGLQRHPEGGWYREIFRSPHEVETTDGRGRRSAFTLIHFLLLEGETSAWHQVLSDETWHWAAGGRLELSLREPEFGGETTRKVIGPADGGDEPVAVVPAGYWQAARPLDGWCLVQCGVAPGFDFADFRMR